MSSWHTFEPAQFFPAPVQSAVTAFSAVSGASEKALKATEKALRIVQRLSKNRVPSAVEAALRTSVNALDSVIDGFATNTQCHGIVIPIRRRVASGGDIDLELELNPGEPAYNYVNRVQASVGGTPVFFRTLLESVQDPGDLSKPDFPSTYATAGVCVIAGAETLADLQVPLRLLQTLYVGNQRIAPSAAVLPVVQSLKVSASAVRGGTGVHLTWDPLPPVTNLPLFTGDVILAKEIFLIRTKGALTQGWSEWSDFFNEEPRDDPSHLPRKGDAEVIARIRNHGFVRSYTDTRNLLDPKDTYYYTACVRYAIGNEIQPMGSLSNVARVTRKYPTPSTRTATPPDWYATPSLIDQFPPLERLLGTLRAGVQRLGSRTTVNTGTEAMVEQTLEQIQRLLAQYEQTNAEVTEIAERLQMLTAAPPAGMYATVISKSSGGVQGWLSELARRLSDEADPDRPDFSPTSVTVGLVILAGAPSVTELAGVLAMLQALFGARSKSPLAEIVAQFDANPAPTPTTPTAAAPPLGYDAAMRPSTEPTC